MLCPACQAPHKPTQRFCAECGAALQAASTSPAPVFVAPAVVAAFSAATVSLPVPPPKATGERRAVSIVFADLTNYTGLSGELDAEDLHAMVRSYTQRVTAAVHAFGGTVERYIGDSVMAAFGAPLAHGDDALRAVRAALAIQTEVMPALSQQYDRTLQASIGISFGEVMFTQGEPGHPEGLAVVGETVNLGARVQGQAGAGNIVVSDTQRSACGPRLQTEFLGDKVLKGIARSVKLYRVLGLQDAAQGTQSRLLGRDTELALMRQAVAQCSSAVHGSLLHFRGEPGIGKSRLLEALHDLSTAAGMASHACAYLDFGLEQSLSGIAALVASLLGIAPSDGILARQAAVQRAIQTGLLAADDAGFASDTLRLPLGNAERTVLDALDPAARQAALRNFVLQLVTQAAAQRPLVLCIEDVHWMPSSELAQLQALCDLARSQPVLVATASRMQADPLLAYFAQLGSPPWAHVLEVGPLSAEAARQVALEFNPEHAQTIDACIAQADGNPLFLEQLLRHAAETGQSSVPGSVHNVVLARLDRLEATDRHAAQCAAVIGQRFGLGLLRKLMPHAQYDPASLAMANIIKAHGEDWIFAHALVQESAYSALLHSVARAMHREAAVYYAAIDLILRAQHLDRAKAPEAASAYLDAAHEQLAAFHYERARELLARGLEVATQSTDVVNLLLLQGRALHEQGLIPDSKASYQQALAQAQAPGQQARAWLGLAMGMRMSDELDAAMQALAQAEPLAVQAQLVAERSELHYLRGNLHFPRGEMAQCLSEHGQALQWALQSGSALDEALALSGLGDAHYAGSRMQTAQGYFERCMQLCHAHGLGRVESANRFMVATVRMYMNELPAALEDALASAELARRLGHHRAQVVSRLTAGWLYLQQAQPAQAQNQVQLGLAAAQELGAPRFTAFLLESQARIQWAAGEHSAAQASMDEALALAKALKIMRFIGPWLYSTRALVAQSAGTVREALAQGQALIEAGCVGHNYFWFYKHAMQSSLQQGEPQAAEQYAQRLEQHTKAEPTPWGNLFIERTRVLAALQREPSSASALQRAQALLQTMQESGHFEAMQGLP